MLDYGVRPYEVGRFTAREVDALRRFHEQRLREEAERHG